jgi:hypothetical protein
MEDAQKPDQPLLRSRPVQIGLVDSLAFLALGVLLTWVTSGGRSLLASSANPAPANISASTPSQQTNTAGAVTVAVTWAGRSAGPVFAIALDTHSVPLDGYDLRQLAVLRTDQGVEVTPSGWDAPAGGHHRKGTLTFPTTTADGRPVLTATTREVVLVLRDVAGVPERTFRWQL